MKTRIGFVALAALLFAGAGLAQVADHGADTSVVNGVLNFFADCKDQFAFSGLAGQVLWTDVVSPQYIKQDGKISMIPTYCIQVLDRYDNILCFSGMGGNDTVGSGPGMGFPAATNACILPAQGPYKVRVSLILPWDQQCGDAPILCSAQNPADVQAEADAQGYGFFNPVQPYQLLVSLRSAAVEGDISVAVRASVNRLPHLF